MNAADLQAAHDLRDQVLAELAAARRALTALSSPTLADPTSAEGGWAAHWSALADAEDTVAEAWEAVAADDDSTYADAAKQALHYRDRATVSRLWAEDARRWATTPAVAS